MLKASIIDGSDRLLRRVAGADEMAYTILEVREAPDAIARELIVSMPIFNGGRILMVMDSNVALLYRKPIESYLRSCSIELLVFELDCTEAIKTLDTAIEILRLFDGWKVLRRSEPIVAVGGGVLLDVVGFACSVYRRGLPYIRVPTTLMAIVDAAIGTKTGVNFIDKKNFIGSYFPPKLVLIDRTFLGSLDRRNIRNGVSEIIKIGLVKDHEIISMLEISGEQMVARQFQGAGDDLKLMRKAVVDMVEEIEDNMREMELARLVDFGHTFSPTIEMLALPRLLHGEAVAIDMAICIFISSLRGLIDLQLRERLLAIFKRLGIATYDPICTPDVLILALDETRRHRNGEQRVPLPNGFGSVCFVNDINGVELQEAVQQLKAFNGCS